LKREQTEENEAVLEDEESDAVVDEEAVVVSLGSRRARATEVRWEEDE
jgi:hypothetical protein